VVTKVGTKGGVYVELVEAKGSVDKMVEEAEDQLKQQGKTEKEIQEIKDELQDIAEGFKENLKGLIGKGDFNNLGLISNQFRDDLFVLLFRLGKVAVKAGALTASEVVKYIKEQLAKLDYKHLFRYVDMFADEIATQLDIKNDLHKKKRYGQKNEMEFYTTHEEKIKALRAIFRELFDVMKDAGFPEPERAIYLLSQDEEFRKAFKNEDTLFNYVNDVLKKTNPILANIIMDERLISFGELVSMKNFYSNLRLMKAVVVLKQKGGKFKIHNQNQNDRTHEFMGSIRNTLRTLTYGDIRTNPNAAFHALYNEYMNKDTGKVFVANRDYADNESKRKAEIVKISSEFLEKITGINKGTWIGYFNETNEKDFFIGKYDIPAILTFMSQGTETNIFADKTKYTERAIDYFIKKPAKSDSNLTKLINTATDTQSIALAYDNVVGNKETSFEQMSDLLISAQSVQEKLATKFYEDNPVLKHYKDEKEIPIVKVNGMSNKQTGTDVEAEKLSDEDVIITQLVMFAQNIGKSTSYMQSIGQFGDKKQMYMIEVPRYANPQRTYQELLKNNPNASSMATIEELLKEAKNLDEITVQAEIEFNKTDMSDKSRSEFLKDFVFNFAINKYYSDLIFHGKLDQYKNFTMMVKRAGSTNSPGYVPDMEIEGGIGQTQKHLIINENVIALPEDPEFEMYNGVQFMTREFADKLAVSMGSIFSRNEDFGKLNSAKALYSIVLPGGKRGLTKTNMVVIDELADAFPDSHFAQIRKIMQDAGAETLSFNKSGTKIAEGPTNDNIFVNGEIVMPKEPLVPFERSNKNFFIQQDLRHDTVADMKKQPIQTIGNFLNLDNAEQITAIWNAIQDQAIEEAEAELAAQTPEEYRDNLLELIDEESLPELYSYVKNGGNGTNLYFDGLVAKIKASYIRRTVLERKVNRVAMQEIPVGNVKLATFRKTADGKHTVLAECAVNIEGIRYTEDSRDYDTMQDAVDYILEKDMEDMIYKEKGVKKVKTWELVEINGKWKIPGEPLIITRVPADDLHSHTIARAKYRIPGAGNVIMTDAESQSIAGSDNDGDKRFVETYIKEKGRMVTDQETIKGKLNKAMALLVNEYEKVKNFDRIRNQIALKKYDHIIDNNKKDLAELKHNSFESNIRVRRENFVGRKVIGIAAKLSTTFDFVRRLDVKLKKKFKVQGIQFNGFSVDKYGLLKHHIGNLLNLALDNAKDPKIEYLGFNEITTNMFITALILDNSMDGLSRTEQEAFIIKRIEKISKLFTKGIGKDFITLERNRARTSDTTTTKQTFDELKLKYGKDAVMEFQKLYYTSREISDFTSFIDLSRSIPDDIETFEKMQEIRNKIRLNLTRNIDFSNVYDEQGIISPYLRSAEISMNIAKRHVFNNAIENTVEYDDIRKRSIPEKKPAIRREEIDDQGDMFETVEEVQQEKAQEINNAFRRNFRKLLSLFSMDTNQTIRQLHNDLVKIIEENPTNKFLSYLQVSLQADKTMRIEILNTFRQANIPEATMKEIQDDFDALPAEDKKKFVLYSIHNFGLTISSWGGNYAKFFSPKYLAVMDELFSERMEEFRNGNVRNKKQYVALLKEMFADDKNTWRNRTFDVNLKKLISEALLGLIETSRQAGKTGAEIDAILNERISKNYAKNERAMKVVNETNDWAKKNNKTLEEALKNNLEQELDIDEIRKRELQAKYPDLPDFQVSHKGVFLNNDQSKPVLAKSNRDKGIVVDGNMTKEQFLAYITGSDDTPGSRQKEMVFEMLALIGYDVDKIETLLADQDAMMAFMIYHELAKFVNYDIYDTKIHQELRTNPTSNYALEREYNATLFAIQKLDEAGSLAASQFVNHSGGAPGADTAWRDEGLLYGVNDQRHYYHGDRGPKNAPNGNIRISEELFEEARKHVYKANETLLRKPDNYMDLLARDWEQVRNSDAVFAVKALMPNRRTVDGGTGWAVQMAIDNNKPVYLFDQEQEKWFFYNYSTQIFEETDVPTLTQNFAGVGTKNLNEAGRKAIRDVYAKTFASMTPKVNKPAQVAPQLPKTSQETEQLELLLTNNVIIQKGQIELENEIFNTIFPTTGLIKYHQKTFNVSKTESIKILFNLDKNIVEVTPIHIDKLKDIGADMLTGQVKGNPETVITKFSNTTDALNFAISKVPIAVSYTHLTLPTIYSV